MTTVAALFVEKDGCYYGLPDVDPWDIERDARTYAGPHPVVAHPPCQRWGRYWSGGPSARVRRELGDDEGCFASALASVRRWGGVIEHPEGSHAWRAFKLMAPPRSGGWVAADRLEGYQGWTCCVEQGAYGHPARKATWLYAHGIPLEVLESLTWGKAPGDFIRLDQGCHSTAERQHGQVYAGRRLTSREAKATPTAFRDLLISMARSVKHPSLEAAE